MSTIQGWNSTTRALEQARAANLGDWKSTFRLNKEDDRNSRTNGIVGMAVGTIVATASALFLERWHPASTEVRLAVLALGAIGVVLVVVFARGMVHRYRRGVRGMLLAHVYEVGVVFERTLGDLFTVPLNRAKIRYVTWDDGDDERHREQLWVTCFDGTVRAVETWTADECKQLSMLASCLGLGDNPQTVEPEPAARWFEVL